MLVTGSSSGSRRTRSTASTGSTASSRLPYSLKVLLENLLRYEDGMLVTAEQISALAGWQPAAEHGAEVQFTPARVLLQDFTGVPCVVDLVAMRDAMAALGGDPSRINPLIPVELVIDHSVIADAFARPDAFRINAGLEFERNQERYQLLRWAQQAFDDFLVVPPDTGICHQVNLEHLARVVFTRDGPNGMQAYPDTLVGTDSHTPMINGLGVLGWGVGGIEAEAAMLGQPMSMLIPQVLGIRLTGELREGTTATDLVLTVAELLRRTGVVGKFVEFYGPGVANGAAREPGDAGQHEPGVRLHLRDLPDRRRDADLSAAHRPARVAGAAGGGLRQGAGPLARPRIHSRLLARPWNWTWRSVEPSIAGPKRPQDRIALTDVRAGRRRAARRRERQARPAPRAGRGLRRVVPGQRPHRRQREPCRATSRRSARSTVARGRWLSAARARSRSPTARRRRSTTGTW